MTTALAVALTTVLALPGGWLLGRRDRTVARRLERDARPAGPHGDALADAFEIGWQHLLASCCLRSWETAGPDPEHDPATCTRKDHTQ